MRNPSRGDKPRIVRVIRPLCRDAPGIVRRLSVQVLCAHHVLDAPRETQDFSVIVQVRVGTDFTHAPTALCPIYADALEVLEWNGALLLLPQTIAVTVIV